jgi:3-oxoacyl-[acyl-carrier protein] reductase
MLERTPLKSLATGDDVASAITFLLGDKASSITGTNLLVDAGYSAGYP